MKTLTAEELANRASAAHGRLVQNEPSAALSILESTIWGDDMPTAERLDALAAGDHARADAETTALAFNRHIDASWNAAIEAAAKRVEHVRDETGYYSRAYADVIRVLKREAK